jgi:hypothetical protein
MKSYLLSPEELYWKGFLIDLDVTDEIVWASGTTHGRRLASGN